MFQKSGNLEEKYPSKIEKWPKKDQNLVYGNTDAQPHGKHLEKTGSSSSNVLECIKVRYSQ